MQRGEQVQHGDDGSRYNENEAPNPRLTFGEMRIYGSKGHLDLDYNGDVTIKPLGEAGYRHTYAHEDRGFAGDCVCTLQRHFVERMLDGGPFESSGEEYLKTVQTMEACYRSTEAGEVVNL